MANGNGKQSDSVTQSEINGILWKACDTFRGAVDPSEYKNYILVMLFVKYIADVWQDHYDQAESRVRRSEKQDCRGANSAAVEAGAVCAACALHV